MGTELPNCENKRLLFKPLKPGVVCYQHHHGSTKLIHSGSIGKHQQIRELEEVSG